MSHQKLGYGCSSLMGRVSRRGSLEIVNEAFDAGIRYFDVARSYGYGRAESVLGEFSQGKRDQVILATKAGFSAPPQKFHVGLVKSVLKPVADLVPIIRPYLRRKAAAALVSRPPLTPVSLRASLELSLRELRTDYVDILLLHEATATELADGDLLETLQSMVTEGKVRKFGVGSDLGKISDLLALRCEYLQVLQLENNPGVRAFETFDLADVPMVNTHRAVGEMGRKIITAVQAQSVNVADWSARTGIDLKDPRQMSALLLAYSLRQNPKGYVLFSTLNSKHLRENVRLAVNIKQFSPTQFLALEDMVRTFPAVE